MYDTIMGIYVTSITTNRDDKIMGINGTSIKRNNKDDTFMGIHGTSIKKENTFMEFMTNLWECMSLL